MKTMKKSPKKQTSKRRKPMSKKNRREHQALDTSKVDTLNAQADEMGAQEAEEKEVETKPMTEAEKNERIKNLLYLLREAKATKDTGKQKKLRRQLRAKPLNFYISAQKERVMEIMFDLIPESTQAE
jgi:hypothetical protein